MFQESHLEQRKNIRWTVRDVWKMEKSLLCRTELYEEQYWATVLEKYIESLHGGGFFFYQVFVIHDLAQDSELLIFIECLLWARHM